jgi:N6-L-threonylcarbamoyladenine synthase
MLSKKYGKKIIIPSFEFCGDNAAMIAFRGKSLFETGRQDSLNAKPYPSLGENYFHTS